MTDESQTQPFISADTTLPEITLKGTILAIFLTIILGAANTYLGLKVGITVSASIPAAVISMGLLRFFRTSNILENNIVQTAASAGEALTAGVSYTIPALIVIHYWSNFDYLTTAIIALTGGILGVLFSVPLRRILLADKTLRFPEGTAIGKVLMASSSAATGLKNLVYGGIVGAVISLCQTGFKILSDQMQLWFRVANTIVGGGLGFAPALIGAGYIIGINICLSIFLGVVLGWVIGVPVLSYIYGIDTTQGMTQIAMQLWGDHIRYIGLGAMMVGGLWAVVTLVKPVVKGIHASIRSVIEARQAGAVNIPRTERDISIMKVFWGTLLLLIPIYFVVNYFVIAADLKLTYTLAYSLNITSLVLIIVMGFALAAVCGYFVGLVGSSASPISSMALISLIVASFIVLLFVHGDIVLAGSDRTGIAAAAVAIVITAIIACTATICNDTIQDLKAGQMVGATPWKQQVMLILGVIVAAFSIPLILQLLFDAYGLAGVMPHPNMDPSQMLLAPQAGLMSAIVQGIFTHSTQWSMIITGGVIAVFVLVFDEMVKHRGWRLPVLAVGIGIYLPVGTSMSLVLGGVLSYIVETKLIQKYQKQTQAYQSAHQSGLLLACGLVAGAAVMGVLIAIPFVIKGNSDVLNLMPAQCAFLAPWLGLLATIILCVWFAVRVLREKHASS